MHTIHNEIIQAEATLLMERIMRHLMPGPSEEETYLFLCNILHEARGLLVDHVEFGISRPTSAAMLSAPRLGPKWLTGTKPSMWQPSRWRYCTMRPPRVGWTTVTFTTTCSSCSCRMRAQSACGFVGVPQREGGGRGGGVER